MILLKGQERTHSGPRCIVTEIEMQRVKKLKEWDHRSVKVSNRNPNPNGSRPKRLCDISGRKAEWAGIMEQEVSVHKSVTDPSLVFLKSLGRI